MQYHYEAIPVLFNIFIFIVMLYTFSAVYNNGMYIKRRYTPVVDYIFVFVLISLYSTYAFTEPDFYHYEGIFKYMDLTGTVRHIEPIYAWIKNNIANDYILWRFAVWGTATVLMLQTIRRLELKIETAICFLAMFYLIAFTVSRVSIGISLMFLGYSLIVKPSQWMSGLFMSKMPSYIIGLLMIIGSFFFHRTMFIAILFLLTTFLKFKKSAITVSLILFPFLVTLTTYLVDYIMVAGLSGVGADMQIGGKVQGYVGGEKRVANIFGQLQKVVQYTPIVMSIYYITRKVVYEKVKLPSHIYPFFVYWYITSYVAFLFSFQEVSNWIFARVLSMAYFPMIVVLTYFYSNNKQSRFGRAILLFGLLWCAYTFSYCVYSRFRAEGLI